jgi:CheY-like chemotaxis protein
VSPRRTRVLVADDHPGMLKATCRLLSMECEVVASVADGGALLEAVQRLQPDVIVLDVNLPGVDGLEACRRITQVNPQIKIIVFTAMSEQDVEERSFAAGASAFVPKLASGGLLSAINRLCVGQGLV